MRSIEKSAFNSFTRGGQFLNHFLRMAKDNIVRYVFVALVIGSPFGYYTYETRMDSHDRFVLLSEAVMFTTVKLSPNTDKEYTLDRRDGSSRIVKMRERHNDSVWAADAAAMWDDLKAVFWVTVGTAITVLLGVSIVAAGVGRALATDKHQRGARMERLSMVRRTIRQYNAVEKRKVGQAYRDDLDPYNIATVPFPYRAETQHLMVIGSTGSGKTQLLATVAMQVLERGDRMVVYDKMRSFIPRFYRPGRDIMMSPLDLRGVAWDMFGDARDLADWEDNAAAMIPDTGGDDHFWVSTARTVFAHTANKYAKQCRSTLVGGSPKRPKLSEFLSILMRKSHKQLADYLEDTMAAGILDPANERTTSSIRVTIANGVRSLGYLREPRPGEKAFSIREYVANLDGVYDGVNVYMTSREDRHAILQPLITMWVKIFTSAVMSQERDSTRLLWFFLDELPSLNEVPALTAALAEARQYGAAFVVGLQLMSQLRDIYGRDKADTIMGLTRSKVCFNPGDPNTSKVLSEFIGSRETLRREHSISIGANAIRDGQSVASRIHQEAIILPEELSQLENLNGVLSMSGNFSACKFTLTYQSLDEPLEGMEVNPGYLEDRDAMRRCDEIFSAQPAKPKAENANPQPDPETGPRTERHRDRAEQWEGETVPDDRRDHRHHAMESHGSDVATAVGEVSDPEVALHDLAVELVPQRSHPRPPGRFKLPRTACSIIGALERKTESSEEWIPGVQVPVLPAHRILGETREVLVRSAEEISFQ